MSIINDETPHIGGTPLTAEQVKAVKGLGCLRDKRYADKFNVRVITRNGKITSDEHRAIAEAADRFGNGEVAMTTRLSLEIQDVDYNSLNELFEFLEKHGLESGGTGPKVRPIVSCKGTTCQYGLIDTYKLALMIHERFYKGYHSVTLPHKFKIAVGGCPNNCVKPELNDMGIIGQRVPTINSDKCKSCKKCAASADCPIKAFKADEKPMIDKNVCNNCGRCIKACPFGAVTSNCAGYSIYIGGRWGKMTAQGRPLSRLFTDESEVLTVIEKAIVLFRDEGICSERFSDTIKRLGFEYVESKLVL